MATFIKISTITVGSGGAASIDFTSIPATYTDLKIVFSLRNDNTVPDMVISFNGSTADFTLRNIYGNGASVTSNTRAGYGYNTIGYTPTSASTASTFGNGEVYIPNYASANYKSVSVDNVQETNSATAQMVLEAGLWSQTAAINQVTLSTYSNNFAQYSSATLYGIKSS